MDVMPLPSAAPAPLEFAQPRRTCSDLSAKSKSSLFVDSADHPLSFIKEHETKFDRRNQLGRTTSTRSITSMAAARQEGTVKKTGRSDWRHYYKFLFEIPVGSDFLISSDLKAIWRMHLVWAKKDGNDLLNIVTSRFTSTTVVLSLLVSAEINVLFSPSEVMQSVRASMQEDRYHTLEYWTGFLLIASIFFSVAAVIANFTAWSVFASLSKENAAFILRSSMGLYAAQMPSRWLVVSIYLFVTWVSCFVWILLSVGPALVVTLLGIALLVHTASTFSATARIIMATSAMGATPILPKDQEERLSPENLFEVLLHETMISRETKVPVNRQYRSNTTVHDGRILSYHDSIRRRYPDATLEIEEAGLRQKSTHFHRFSHDNVLKEMKDEEEGLSFSEESD